MIGVEIGALCAAVGAVLGGIGGVIRERWKGENSKHALDLQGDQQEAQQAAAAAHQEALHAVAMAPIWQDILARTEGRSAALEVKLDKCLAEFADLAVRHARMEEQIKSLTDQLARANKQHTTDTETIDSLRTELVAARAEIASLKIKLADLTALLHERTDTKETP